jgi:hypothetical protein
MGHHLSEGSLLLLCVGIGVGVGTFHGCTNGICGNSMGDLFILGTL